MNIKQLFTKLVDWGRDHSSDLKMGVGTVGVVGGTALLCKESIKACEIVRDYREQKQEIINQYDEEAPEIKKEVRKLTAKTVGKVALTVVPGVAVEAGGLGLMWSGYSNMKAAFVGVSLAYGELQEFTNKYRQGVREEYGEEADEKLAYNFRTEEVTITDEDGNQTVETVKIYPHSSKMIPSIYARYFVYGESYAAEHSFDYNEHFLHAQEVAANRYFKAHGKLMLNELYVMLGFNESKAGYNVGWIYDPEVPEGDNKINFRTRVVCREKIDEQTGEVIGYEKVHMIDPNVDGMVVDKMVARGLIDE